MPDDKIPALTPSGPGHQFAFYGDSCSGVPGALHEGKLAAINAVVRRLSPEPEVILFPGDEVIGLVPDEAALRAQWRHFFEVEMAWVKERGLRMFHATGNHTTYDAMSERVFAEVMKHLPRNGPEDQRGLSYVVREGDLLLVVVNTLCPALGSEGHLELDWLAGVLRDNADARWTFVMGHHPAFPVNGYVGSYQRTIGDEYVPRFWALLREHGVLAYLCSHILAFDVQCHQGVLQITSAGAGTAHRMPEGVEYLHAVQMAVDADGLRYQVLDEAGDVCERLSWPPRLPRASRPLAVGANAGLPARSSPVVFRLCGQVEAGRPRQTMLALVAADGSCPLWVGLVGRQRQLTVALQPQQGRSPHQWLGPSFAEGEEIDIELMLHADMGPGGILWRQAGAEDWTGLAGASAWGPERLDWSGALYVGAAGEADRETRFAGELSVSVGAEGVRSAG